MLRAAASGTPRGPRRMRMEKGRARWRAGLTIVAVLALALRILYVLHPTLLARGGVPYNSDEHWYRQLAVDVAAGHGFDPHATFYNASLSRWPGYPFVVG